MDSTFLGLIKNRLLQLRKHSSEPGSNASTTFSEMRMLYYCRSTPNHSINEKLPLYADPAMAKVDKTCLEYENFMRINSLAPEDLWDIRYSKHFWWLYAAPVAQLLQELDSERHVTVSMGDSRLSVGEQCIAKSRNIVSANVCLGKLNELRHFPPSLVSILMHDKPLHLKKSAAVWRGASTGHWQNTPEVRAGSVASRMKLVMNWIDNDDPRLDIGIYPLVQEGIMCSDALMLAQRSVKNHLDIACQLSYKYIICLEGNDVATALKWVFASNSIPIMPNPEVESWFMEGLLVPWIHYVPIEADTLDLLEKIEWCEAHPEALDKINSNNHAYIRMFLSPATEKNIFLEVLRTLLTLNPVL